MRVSIVIPVFNSHKAVARQVRYWRSLHLPSDVEIILVDDGSNPPLRKMRYGMGNLTIVETGDDRAWTQGLARNAGAVQATGEMLLMTDIDHILSQEAIEAVRTFQGEKMVFPRYLAVLTVRGELRQDMEMLRAYGMNMKRYARRGFYASVHGNTWGMPKWLFNELGGYQKNRCEYGRHADSRAGEDCHFNRTFNHWAGPRGVKPVLGPRIYMFPVGRYHKDGSNNPRGLFHNLSYG